MNHLVLDTETGASILKSLSDESRLRILLALRGRELCVCQIVNLLGLAPPSVSHHLQILKDAGLVEGNKHGRWVCYRFSTKPGHQRLHSLLEPLLDAIAESDQARTDTDELKRILRVDPTELCRRLNRA